MTDKQPRLAGRGYDGRVFRVEGQLDVVRGCGQDVDIETEEGREINPPWANTARMPWRDDMAVWKDASNIQPLRYEETYAM